MKKNSYSWFLILVFQIIPKVAFAQKEAPIGAWCAIDSTIQTWIDKGYYAGANIIIGNKKQVLFQKSYGNYTEETTIYIASAGKWLAAATIAAVVDEGRISWEDKVEKWLPEFKDEKGQATLRQLFSHTSNYPDYQPKENHRDDYQTLEESVKHIYKLRVMNDDLRKKDNESRENIHHSPLIIHHFQYGGLAMQVAGRMVEIATGKDWESIFQEYIAQPLQMKKAHFIPVDSVGGGHSPMLGGGAVCSVNDYAHFLQMFLNNGIFQGKRILSGRAIHELKSDQIKEAIVTDKGLGDYVKRTRGSSHKAIYGLGLWREELDSKGNATLISSPSWAGAYPWIDYKNGIYGFFLTHIKDGMMGKDGFNSFWTSPVLPVLVRQTIKNNEK